MTKKSTCDWCKRMLSKSKMRKDGGVLWKCDPKGGYKNAIQCLHIYDETYVAIEYQVKMPQTSIIDCVHTSSTTFTLASPSPSIYR